MSFKKIWDALTTILVLLTLGFALSLMGCRLVGYQVYNVISGSMAPSYQVGDLLYVKSVAPEDVDIGDPITFVMNEDLVVATHRVVDIDEENRLFITKGDANKDVDAAPVHFNNLIGVPQFRLPFLGYISNFVQHPPGSYITIGFCIVLLALVFLPDLLFKEDNEEEQVTSHEEEP
jgi:signal peptidase